MISKTHQRLRDATREDHERLERQADIVERVASPDRRADVVRQFHRLHSEIELAVEPWVAQLDDLDFPARRRSQLLARDMAELGAAAAPLKILAAGDVSEALGLMYVLEGSTLGGRVIQRQIAGRGGDLRGLGFLDPYGDEVGPRWRAFLAVIDAMVRTPQQAEAAVSGALAGFRHAELRLCGAPAYV